MKPKDALSESIVTEGKNWFNVGNPSNSKED